MEERHGGYQLFKLDANLTLLCYNQFMKVRNKFKPGDLVVNTKLGVLALIATINEIDVSVIYLDRNIKFESTYDVELFSRFWRIMG